MIRMPPIYSIRSIIYSFLAAFLLRKICSPQVTSEDYTKFLFRTY